MSSLKQKNRAGNHCHSATIRPKFTQKTTRLGQGPCSRFKNAVACSYTHRKGVAIVVTQKICGYCLQKTLWEMYTQKICGQLCTQKMLWPSLYTQQICGYNCTQRKCCGHCHTHRKCRGNCTRRNSLNNSLKVLCTKENIP